MALTEVFPSNSTAINLDAFLTNTYRIVPAPSSRRVKQRHHIRTASTVAVPDQPSSSEIRVFEQLLQHAVRDPTLHLGHVARLDPNLHRIWQLTARNTGRQYVVKCPPSRHNKLLRGERHRLESEGLVLGLLQRIGVGSPIPSVIDEDRDVCNPLRQPYMVRSYVDGMPLSRVRQESTARVTIEPAIERALGSHLRSIISITQPRFGFAHRVLAGIGAKTWAEAFVAMMEAVLRDGEDHLVALPYDSIRFWVSASVGMLNDISHARLVPFGLEDDSNILVDPQTGSIRCLLGWGDVVFGDPLLSTVFSNRGRAFWEGFGDVDAVTGGRHAGREVLYVVYRSVISIVRDHCRSRNNAAALNARRDLNVALSQLAGRVQ